MKRPRCITLAALCLAVATSAFAQGARGTGDSRMPDYTQLIDQLTAQGQAMLADPKRSIPACTANVERQPQPPSRRSSRVA